VNTSILFWIILGTAAALGIYMVQLDINILLDQGLIQDDAFYYFEIANYLLETGNPSFDGINITNGFHPLWQAICLPIFYFWQGELPLRMMLAIAVIFNILSVVLLYKIVSDLTRNTWIALCGCAIFGFHGDIIRTWFNGLETALHIFTLLLFLRLYLQAREKQVMALRDHLLLGTVAAFAFLARTDSAVIIAVMLVFLYIPLFLGKQSLRLQIGGALAAAFMILSLSSPWLLWNIQQFGSIVQVSGKMSGSSWLTGGVLVNDQPFYIDIASGILNSINPLGNVVKKLFIPVPAPNWTGYLFIFPLIGLTLYCQKKYPAFSLSFRRLWPFFLGVAVLFFYHAGVRAFVRSWYSTPVLLALALLICLLLHRVISQSQRKAAVCLTLLVIALLTVYSPYRYTRSPTNITPDPRIAAAQWLNQNTPMDTRVGAANAGIVGYYAKASVINLDGVVNEHAFRARITDQIHRYIDESAIDYLVDHKGSMAHLCAENSYYHCEELGRWNNATVVARVVRTPQAPHIHSAKPLAHPAI
jgi:hypothetical protein